jgi:PEP-CTERM motif
MLKKLKLVIAVFFAGAMAAPFAMAQTAPSAPAAAKEFVAETPNVPQLGKPIVSPRNQCTSFPNPCTVPEPGSLPLIAVAAFAAFAVMRRKK